MPRKSWGKKAEDKLGEFLGVCVSAFVVFLFGVFMPAYYALFSILAFVVLLVGTLAVLGLTKD